MMRILWKTGKERSIALLCIGTAMLLFFFFFIGESPAWAEQIESHSHASSGVLCPKCDKPLTVVAEKEATCMSRGMVEYNCDECNDYHKIIYSEEAPHSWKQISSTPSTCTESGSITRQCKVCGKQSKISDGSAMGHNYKETVVPPTCSEIGYTDHTCSRCGDSYRDSETAMIPHTYSETVEIEPTCQTVGFLRHTCLVCEHSYTQEMPIVEHDWNFSVVEPTHTEQGFTVYSCRFCETVKRGSFTDPRPYDMVWTVQDATCNASGLKVGYCSDGCGYTETVVIPRLNHEFGDWMTIRRPDADSDGIESHVCSRCGVSEMRQIPYDPKLQETPQTESSKMNWLALGSVAVVSVVAVIMIMVMMLLLLENAHRQRTKRARRTSPSVPTGE